MSGFTEEDLRECNERLAKALGRVHIPHTVWGPLLEWGLPFAAIREQYRGEEWDELVKEARQLLKEEREANPTTNLPPDSRERGTPTTARIELDAYTQHRSEAFSEVAGALANRWARVREFRDLYLGGVEARLPSSEAGTWLYGGRAPAGALEDLSRISRLLSRAFRWRIGDADWFVLTGRVPFVKPISVSVHLNGYRDLPSYRNKQYHLEDSNLMVETAEIVVTAEPWVDSRVVSRVFKDVQRQLRGGDNRKTMVKVLSAVQFVARRIGTGKLRWPELQAGWNREHPEWRHDGRNGLYEAFHNFLRPGYREPKFPEYELTPWQEARRAEDWKKAEELSRR